MQPNMQPNMPPSNMPNMNSGMPNNTPGAPQMPKPMPKEGSNGPLAATVIILIVIILGGIYFWHEHMSSAPAETMPAQTQTQPDTSDQATAAIQAQSSSDDTTSIMNDLNNTNTNVGADLSQ